MQPRSGTAVPPAGPADGRVPLSLRIGVTGHRELDDAREIDAAVERVVAHIVELVTLPTSNVTPTTLTAVSSLADGADRLVADVVLRCPGARLEAVLPFPVPRFLDDFKTETSRDEFHRLLDRAASTTVVRSESREQGYEQAGYEVVDRSDVVIAIWDGVEKDLHAGTSATVRHARSTGKPVFWVRTVPPGDVSEEVGGEDRSITSEDVTPLSAEAFERLDRYNRETVRDSAPDDLVNLADPEIARHAADLPEGALDAVRAWALPYHQRAGQLAAQNQRPYRRSSMSMFVLAPAAVAVVAVQLTLWHSRWVVLGEIVLLATVLVLLQLGRRRRWHDRWISYRYLAEWVRSAVYLCLVGIGDRSAATEDGDLSLDPTAEWLQRAFMEVWLRRPLFELEPADARPLSRFLAEAWIGDQRRYHAKTGRKQARLHERYAFITEIMFALTIVVAIVHVVLSHGWVEDSLSFAAVALPVSAAALSGLAAQREYKRHADRYDRMAHRLDRMRARMEVANDLESVRQVATDTESLMREESSDWFGVVRLHNVELPF